MSAYWYVKCVGTPLRPHCFLRTNLRHMANKDKEGYPQNVIACRAGYQVVNLAVKSMASNSSGSNTQMMGLAEAH